MNLGVSKIDKLTQPVQHLKMAAERPAKLSIRMTFGKSVQISVRRRDAFFAQHHTASNVLSDRIQASNVIRNNIARQKMIRRMTAGMTE